MSCLKQESKPCSGSIAVCELTKTQQCCWHADSRSASEKATYYLDKYGFVDFSSYKIDVPMDIHYCPACKRSAMNRDDLTKLLESSANVQIINFLENQHQKHMREQKLHNDKQHKQNNIKMARTMYFKYLHLLHNYNVSTGAKRNALMKELNKLQSDLADHTKRNNIKQSEYILYH